MTEYRTMCTRSMLSEWEAMAYRNPA